MNLEEISKGKKGALTSPNIEMFVFIGASESDNFFITNLILTESDCCGFKPMTGQQLITSANLSLNLC